MNLSDYIIKKDRNIITKPFYNYDKGTKLNHEIIINDLIEVCEILDQYDIDYNILFGSLLGMYRDGKLISHDPDVDLAIKFNQQLNLIQALEELTNNMGFKIIRYSINQLVSIYKNNVYIDIYTFKTIGDYYRCADYSIHKDVFDNDNTINCDGYDFKTIKDPETFFENMYGLDWRTPLVGSHAHPSRKGKTHG